MHKLLTFLFISCSSIVLAGCSVDTLEPPVVSDSNMVWDIRLNHQAVLLSTISPYDTILLITVPRNSRGEALHLDGKVAYRTSSEDIMIDSMGIVHALNPTSQAWIIAELTHNNIKYTDSTSFSVVGYMPTQPATRIVFDQDHAKQPVFSRYFTLWVQPDKMVEASVLDDNNNPFSAVPVRYSVKDSMIASVQPYVGQIRGFSPGSKTWIFANVTVFGVALQDSLEIEVVPAMFAQVGVNYFYHRDSVDASKTFAPSEIEINRGGTVLFIMNDSLAYDVIFDDSVNVQRGNLPGFVINGIDVNLYAFGSASGNIDPTIPTPVAYSFARSFPVSGRYKYRSRTLNSEGLILVK